MRWTSDLSVGALYFRLTDDAIVRQEELGDGLIADVGADDSIVGLEVISRRGRELVLGEMYKLGLPSDDINLVMAVLAGEVAGDRERLGIVEPPQVESADQYQARVEQLV